MKIQFTDLSNQAYLVHRTHKAGQDLDKPYPPKVGKLFPRSYPFMLFKSTIFTKTNYISIEFKIVSPCVTNFYDYVIILELKHTSKSIVNEWIITK